MFVYVAERYMGTIDEIRFSEASEKPEEFPYGAKH